MGARRWSFPTTGRSISMADAAAAVEATERAFAALAHPPRRHILLTDDSYMDQGIPILGRGQNAHRLFAAQSAKEKRGLLNFLLSNSTWAQGKLAVEFKEPFDLLIETVWAAARTEAANGSVSVRNEVWLGDLDSNQGWRSQSPQSYR